jgi:hypothetical protein
MPSKTKTTTSHRLLIEEIEALPPEYHALLLQMIRAFREGVALKPAAESFARGWREANNGEVRPISRLWEGIDGE